MYFTFKESRDFTTDEDWETEEWTQTLYHVEDNKNCYRLKHETNSKFRFPAENVFLPKDLDLKFDESLKWPHLRKIVSDENSELWYKMDHIFRLPKVQASIRFGNSIGQETLESRTKLDLTLYVLGIVLENIDQISVLAEAGYKVKVGGNFKNAEMKPPLKGL